MAWSPDYLTPAEGRAYLRIADIVDDAQIGNAITAASRAIDTAASNSCRIGRQFGLVAAAEERFYTAEWDRDRARWVVPVDDLMSTVGLVVEVQDVDGAAVGTITAYTLEPRNAAAKGRPWTRLVVNPNATLQPNELEHGVAITALWGWSAVPKTILQTCCLQMSRFMARRDSPFGIAGSPDVGSELRLLARLDPDAALMMASYRRWEGCTA